MLPDHDIQPKSTPNPDSLGNVSGKVNAIIDQIGQELIDWNYGTVYKLYDTEETAEVLEEDTREYLNKLKTALEALLRVGGSDE